MREENFELFYGHFYFSFIDNDLISKLKQDETKFDRLICISKYNRKIAH